jgi:hypothetical protein
VWRSRERTSTTDWKLAFVVRGGFLVSPSSEARPGYGAMRYRPEDVLKVDCDEDGVGGDDAADALRYLGAASPATEILTHPFSKPCT